MVDSTQDSGKQNSGNSKLPESPPTKQPPPKKIDTGDPKPIDRRTATQRQ